MLAALQSFIVTLYPLTTLLPPLLLALLRPLTLGTLNHLPAGPTPLIFALLAQYHAAIPHIYKYRVATGFPSSAAAAPGSGSSSNASPDARASAAAASGLLLSDKSTAYLLAAQLALSQLPGSALGAGLGWALGAAWRVGVLPERLAGWRVPRWAVGDGGPSGDSEAVGAGRDGEGFEGLRRRLEEAGRASAVEGAEEGEARRRGGGRGD